MSSVYKLYGKPLPIWPWATGLALLVGNLLAGLLLPLLIGGPLWIFAARGKMGPMPPATRIMLRAATLGLIVTVLLVLVFGVTNIQTRWLVPIMIFATAAVFGWMAPVLSQKAFRTMPVMAVICAAITILGMAEVRNGTTATRDLTPLTELVTRLHPDRIEGDFFLAGNLKLLYPDLDIRYLGETAALKDWPPNLLILGALPDGVIEVDSGTLQLISPVNPDKPLNVNWHMVAAPN